MNEVEKRVAAAGRANRPPRIGVVTSVSLADSSCMVLISEGEYPAYLTDQVWNSVAVGAVVTLLPVGDTYEVISTRTGTTGGGGLILGPELIPNGGFEFGSGASATGWSRYPWALGEYETARDLTVGEMVSGVARMLVTLKPDATVDPDVNVWTSQAIRVDPGVAYQGSVWIKATAIEASLTATLRVITAPTASGAQYFGAGATSVDLAVVSAPGAAYQLLTGSVTVPTGHQYARVFTRSLADNAIAAPIAVSWDVVSLRQRITS